MSLWYAKAPSEAWGEAISGMHIYLYLLDCFVAAPFALLGTSTHPRNDHLLLAFTEKAGIHKEFLYVL